MTIIIQGSSTIDAGSPPSAISSGGSGMPTSITGPNGSVSPTLAPNSTNDHSSSRLHAPVVGKVSSTYLLKKFHGADTQEIDVYQIDPLKFTFARDGFQFVFQDPDVREIVASLDNWSQNLRTRQVKTKIGELQWHMESHMRRFLRKVLPPQTKAFDVKFRMLPIKDGGSLHQNEKPELHKDFNKHDFRVWLPRRHLDGGLIVSPNTDAPFQLFGGQVDVGDAWVFHSGVYHGASPWKEPEDRGYFGTVSFCTYSEGSCWNGEEEMANDLDSPFLLAE